MLSDLWRAYGILPKKVNRFMIFFFFFNQKYHFQTKLIEIGPILSNVKHNIHGAFSYKIKVFATYVFPVHIMMASFYK